MRGSDRVAWGVGGALAVLGMLASLGAIWDVPGLAGLGVRSAPVRPLPALGLGLCGVAILAAVLDGRVWQTVLSGCAAALGSWSLPAGSALVATLVAILLVADAAGARGRITAWLSAVPAAATLIGLVERTGLPLDAPAGGLRITPAGALLGTTALVGLHLVLVRRNAGVVHAMWTEGSLRALMLRRAVLPIPAIGVPPLVVIVAILGRTAQPDAARIVGRLGLATVAASTVVAAVLSRRIARDVAGRIEELSGAAGRVAEGDLDTDVIRSGPRELAELGGHFERMRVELRRRVWLDGLVRRTARAMSAAGDLSDALGAIGKAAGEVVGFERASLAVDERDQGYRLAAVWGPQGWRFPVGGSVPVSKRVLTDLRAGRAVVVDDTTSGGWEHEVHELAALGIRSFISVPILNAGELRAVLNLSSTRPGAFRPEDAPVLETLVRETAGSLPTLLLLDREREATRRLRELDELKTEFVGIVAHDIRSPLTVIGGFVQTLLNRWERISDERRLEYLETIRHNTERLNMLVEDVLQVASIESGSLDLTLAPFDLGALVRRIVNDMAVVQTDREWCVQAPDEPARVLADEGRVHQVLTNLIGNAMKFSPVFEPIEVRLAVGNGMVRTEVADRGKGISPDDVPRIFEKFFRIQPPDGPKVHGTGLGLYICRSLVESQGGRIWAQSKPGCGSTFAFTLPSA